MNRLRKRDYPDKGSQQPVTNGTTNALIPCPVCDSEDFTTEFELQNEQFVRCRGCGLLSINPQPTIAATTATYDEDYSAHYIRKAGKKLKRCARWVGRIKRRYNVHGTWLDVGCSAGFVVRAARDQGFDAYGVEIESAAVHYATENLGLESIQCGTLEDQRYPDGRFNVISLYDVIEHVPDLTRHVAELYRIAAPGAIVEIRTPDLRHWSTPNDLATWKEVKPSEHLFYFDATTLTRLFERHGFETLHRRFMFKPALDICFRKPG